MTSKRKNDKHRKQHRKIRLVLLNLIVIVMALITLQLILQLIVPATKEQFKSYDADNMYKIELSEDDLTKLPQTIVDEVNSYGETINIDSTQLGNEFQVGLYDTTTNTVNCGFKINQKIDVGINTHDMPVGSYFIQLDDSSFVSTKQDLNINFNTITRNGVNNKITVDSIDGLMHITKYEESKNTDELDILVDPGHGGNDIGASAIDDSIYEKDLNLQLATIIANDLTDLGYNVGLTRQDDTNPGTCDDNVSSYCPDGRVSLAYNNNAKMVLSVHHNTGGATGYEVYTSYYASTKLADLVATYLADISTPSTKSTGYISDGVYQEVFEDDVDPSIEQDYMYMIRETGGIATNSLSEENQANNSSPQGAQGLLIEFGYLDDYNDLAHITDSNIMDQEAKAVVNAVDSYLNPDTTSLIDLTTDEKN